MSEHEAIRKALVQVRQMPGNMTDPVQRVIKVFESQEAYRRATNPDAISALLADRDRLAAEVASIHGKLDAMLKHCPDSECYTCSAIICPHGDAMHFHHDGCPTCAAIDTASPEEGTS